MRTIEDARRLKRTINPAKSDCHFGFWTILHTYINFRLSKNEIEKKQDLIISSNTPSQIEAGMLYAYTWILGEYNEV